jgi:dTDP-4-dehydrorhamnose 3,5-epimerase
VKFTQTKLAGLTVVELNPITDDRGFFSRAWCTREFEGAGLHTGAAQMNVSFNRYRGTVRGLHYQLPPHAEQKLVRCIAGAIFDVAVDLRPESKTYKQWFGIELSQSNRLALCIPEGFAHGYQALSDDSEVLYLVSSHYHKDAERGARFDDPSFAIQWPLPPQHVSEKDRASPLWSASS